MPSPDQALRRLVEVLDRLEVPFFVGGSVASSFHGTPRATLDVDLIAAVDPRHVDRFVAELGREFYADEHMIRDALEKQRSFNLIHLATSYKFDVFPLGSSPYAQEHLSRSARKALSLSGETPIDAPLESAEDTLLNKLAWYRASGGTSDRQWNDIRGIVAVQKYRLDRAYLKRWAPHLKVEDLLDRALSE